MATGLDISFNIIKGEPHLTALTSCALVCQDWYSLTWYHLRQRIHLRDRKDVLSLSKTLRAKPRLREVIQQVVISGALPGERQPIRHLGTFAVMLAGKAPRLSRLTVEDAEWTIGSVRMEDIGFLGVFSYIDTVRISNVTLSSAAQLSQLVSTLPRLRKLWCYNVDCLQEQKVSPASLPLNCANLEYLDLRWVAPAVEDFLVQISRASRVRTLVLGVDSELDSSSPVSRSQALLEASSASAEAVELHIDPSSPVMSVMLWLRMDHTTDDLDAILTTLEQDNVLARLDSILQERRFSGTVASRGICIGTHDDNNTWTSGNELIGMGSALRERYDRLDELVRRKMPHSHERDILSFQEFASWRQDVDKVLLHSMQVEQKNTAEDAEGPRGSRD
ncbi:uncharacterized protein B0H18DRAFT_1193579 [Fomitopsis serialis]|uniref:uncharacterized protein n=1 Tax=Fomitopsis serialis TaxID=139415 RepID=UPI0020085614|nr:uncharacterized protein B0H18DRAFT_1193579 [Neoantrodia serialis]KAH9920116.1 hypothetical protein B0H18DRAFT_1193579 [Neoantrodia serialis]